MNLDLLRLPQVDWLLKQMLQAMLALGYPPDRRLIDYGNALYEHIGIARDGRWVGDFTVAQREWIDSAAAELAIPIR